MDGLARQQRIRDLVDGYLQQERPLADYLAGIDPSLQPEVGAHCQDAQFARAFFAAMPKRRPLPRPPTRIADCDVGPLLGQGAMGQVYRGRQTALQRDVAIKLIRAEFAHHDDFLTRFREEARLLASIDHPGIVKVLSFGSEDGWLYFVMELVPGPSLADELPRLHARPRSAPRRFDRTARLVAEVLETLAYAHKQGIVHRDIKPSNIVLDANDRPKLVDFGLARAAESPLQTQDGRLVGTPAFFSPELAARRGHDRMAADGWAVGVLLYQLLTTRLPFAGATTDEMLASVQRAQRSDPRRLVPDVPADLAAIVARALAPAPADRYPSAATFAADLRRFLAGEPVAAGRATWGSRLRRHLRRHGRRYVAAGLLLVLGGATWSLATTRAHRERLAASLDAIARTAAAAGLEARATGDLAHAAAEARRWLGAEALDATQRATLLADLGRLEGEASRRHDGGRGDIVRGAGSPRGAPTTGHQAPSPALVAAGSRLVAEARLIAPALPDATAVVAATHPLLRVVAPVGRDGAAVRVHAVDPDTSQSQLVAAAGDAPCELRVPPGHYRVVVGDLAAFAEISLTLLAPGTYPVEPVLRETAAVQSAMQFVPAGEAMIGQEQAGAVVYRRQSVAHPAFFIDRTEVTCEAYHAFCLATATPWPASWRGRYEPAWANLPVVGISFRQAARYAEWCGKRLPTWTEWQIAARGAAGWPYPWGEQAERLPELLAATAARRSQWFGGLHEVGAVALDASWCGAVDMLGNAREWTDSPYVAQLDGVPFAVLPWRIRGGSPLRPDDDPATITLAAVGAGQPEATDAGFRCAKSYRP